MHTKLLQIKVRMLWLYFNNFRHRHLQLSVAAVLIGLRANDTAYIWCTSEEYMLDVILLAYVLVRPIGHGWEGITRIECHTNTVSDVRA